MKPVSALAKEVQELREKKIEADPTDNELRVMAGAQQSVFHRIPADMYFEIFAFVSDIQSLVAMAKTSKLFNEVVKMNLLWQPCLEHTYPKVFQCLDPDRAPASVPWRNLVKEKTLKFKAFYQILDTMAEIKTQGNLHYKQREFDQARAQYRAALKFAAEPSNATSQFEDILDTEHKVAYLHLSAIIHSNSLQVELKTEGNYPRGLMHGVKAHRYLESIQDFMQDSPDEYKAKYEALERKVSSRLDDVISRIGPLARLAHFSSSSVEGLRQGTMLIHNDDPFSTGRGIFGRSRVLLTEYTDSSIVGVIVNKSVAVGPQGLNLGGPCDFQHTTILHDQGDVAGCREVLPGVFEGGDQAELMERKRNPGVRVREFQGFASWFPGQLEGEVLNGNGWRLHNAVTPDDVFAPDLVAVNPADLM